MNKEYLRMRRLELGFSLAEMAKILGLKNPSTYLKYERGEYKLKADMLPILAAKLKCDIERFFYDKNC